MSFPLRPLPNRAITKTVPVGARVLAVYAILFAGLAPLGTCVVGLMRGGVPLAAVTIPLAVSIIYFGSRVFVGYRSAAGVFAVLVALHYFGVAATNLWYADYFPAGSRAAEMAVPRMVRGLFFGSIYLWYFLLRKRTADGFESTPLQAEIGTD